MSPDEIVYAADTLDGGLGGICYHNAGGESYTNARMRTLPVAILEIIGNHLAEVPGRKSLVWISGGIYVLSTGPD